MRIPELLSPAGNMDALRAALHFGADAVYGGMKRFGLRAFAGNFDPDGLQEAVTLAHSAGKKFYVTMNSYPFDDELDDFTAAAGLAAELGADAVIMADPGAIVTLRRKVPQLSVHVSTQANTVNAAAAELYRQLGCERVILAREMSLDRIRALRKAIGDGIQLETFVHGASCMAYSGRCMLSAYLAGRSGNRGECAQPCRWQYAVMEEKRPGEYFPVYEDEKGTYILNSRDMCMIDHLGDLMEAGVDCIKIEGRAKSAYYAAIVTGAYRHCIDDIAAGREIDPIWRDEVEHVSHRIYSTGFYYGQPGQYTENSRYIREWQIVAKVDSCDENGLAECSLNNKFSVGDELEVVGPDLRPFPIVAQNMADAEGNLIDEARTPQMKFTMQLPRQVPAMSMIRRSVDLSAK